MKTLFSAVTIISFTMLSAPAFSMTFQFTGTGQAYLNNVPDGTGTIMGLIEGLTDNTANQPASHFIIESVSPFTFSFLSTPLDLVPSPVPGENDFTVSSGLITNGVFTYQDPSPYVTGAPGVQISFGFPASGPGLSNGQGFIQISEMSGLFDSWLIFVPLNGLNLVATPLPPALPLFATGLGALGLLGWRRKRKALAA